MSDDAEDITGWPNELLAWHLQREQSDGIHTRHLCTCGCGELCRRVCETRLKAEIERRKEMDKR